MRTLLPHRFADLWRRLGAAGDSEPCFRRLLRAHRQPWRTYHGEAHVVDCLAHLDAHEEMADDAIAIEGALWFHDAIYLPWFPANEARSAAWMRREYSAAGVAEARVEAMERLILATRHSELPSPGDEAFLVDIDLSILGAASERYDQYEKDIRREYIWVPAKRYRAGRAEVLQGFLDRPEIYTTEAFHERYEARARVNLKRALGDVESPASV